MSRTLRPEEARIWSLVVSTVRPARTTRPPPPEPEEPVSASPPHKVGRGTKRSLVEGRVPEAQAPAKKPAPPPAYPAPVEPNRLRRLTRERDPIGARLDLHGLDQDRARAALHVFIARAQMEGARAVLIITGKGRLGTGVLRQRVPEWLAEPPSRTRIAGVSTADRRHGGKGALYVALKRPG